jgi:hypothetical protein
MKYSKRKQEHIDWWNGLSQKERRKIDDECEKKMEEFCDSFPLKTVQDYKRYCLYLDMKS